MREIGDWMEGHTYLGFLGRQTRENLNLALIALTGKDMVIFGDPLDGVGFLFPGIAYAKVLNKNCGKATTPDLFFAFDLIFL